jgi:hypothetical protein
MAYFPLTRYGPHKTDAFEISSIVACVFVAAVTFQPRRCLATIEGYTYRHTDCCEIFMDYSVEMGSGVMIYIYQILYTFAQAFRS